MGRSGSSALPLMGCRRDAGGPRSKSLRELEFDDADGAFKRLAAAIIQPLTGLVAISQTAEGFALDLDRNG
jgi:hypothetical protein